jgi:hypothetical protein
MRASAVVRSKGHRPIINGIFWILGTRAPKKASHYRAILQWAFVGIYLRV